MYHLRLNHLKMATKISCPICAFDRGTNQMISCPSCNSDVCHMCVVQFVKTLAGDISCMSCKHPWDRTFIFRSLPPSLVHSTIKQQREEVLFDREKAMLPSTMPLVPLEDQVVVLTAQKKEIEKQIKELTERLINVRTLLYQNKRKQNRIRLQMAGVNVPPAQQQQQNQPSTSKHEEKKEQPTIVCHCPSGDCRGYIMSKEYKCGLCESAICKKCHILLKGDEEHQCNPDNIASVKLIKAECKACPGCGVPSRKTEGCSQVWCMVCKSAWNWNTRKIETGNIHATDYFNYMRRNNVNIPAGPVAQNGCANQYPPTVLPHFRNLYPAEITNEVDAYVRRRYQVVSEYQYIMNRPITQTDNLDLRIQYLRKTIDEKQWKASLHKRDKKFAFDTEIHRIRAAYTHIMNDAINAFCRSQNANEIKTNLENMKNIDKLMQEEYQKLAKAFMSKRQCPFA